MLLHFVRQLWYNEKVRLVFSQTVILSIIAYVCFRLWLNLETHLNEDGIAFGFDFLKDKSGFGIIMHLIPYSESSSYGRAFLVGLLNTLLVSGLGIVIATFLGWLVGIGSLSRFKLSRVLSISFVEIVRNIPLLLQMFFWYFVVLRAAPMPEDSISLFDAIYITNRGIYLPTFESQPVLMGLNFQGGVNLLPEFLALLISLSIYTSAYIAEIVRLGILSVNKGQKEAAMSLGFSPWHTLKLIIMPQALRVILPPLTNQYLNLTKNSSLAVAIAYPDLVGVFAGTVLNQTGYAIEIILMTMAVYLCISLSISGCMLIYEKKTEWGN